MTDPPDLDAYLWRLGLRTRPPPTLDGLRAVHRAHVTRIPYDNLSIVLGRPDPVDDRSCVDRVLRGGRLGYCFHQNAVLRWLLCGLGFEVTTRHGHVLREYDPLAPPSLDHLALVVSGLPSRENPGGHWWADAGLGEAFTEPLPVRAGEYTVDGWSFGLEAVTAEAETWRFRHRPGGTPSRLELSCRDHGPAAVGAAHRRLGFDEGSRFRRTLVVLRHDSRRVVGLRGLVRTDVTAEGQRQRGLTSYAKWRRALVDDLRLPLDDVTDAELRALHERLLVDHEQGRAS